MDSPQNRPKRLLLVVTAGGYSNAAPMFEIAKILHSRGYTIDLATLTGREEWLKKNPFISRLHILGPSLPADVEEESYLLMSSWSSDITSNWGAIFDTKMLMESSWPDAYRGLSRLMQDSSTKPDFIFADYWVDAARDMSAEYDVPLSMSWTQMPTAMMPASYIPGTPGLQIEVLTSEFATLWQRIRNAVAIYTSLPHYIRYLRWLKRMRREAGVVRSLPILFKPDYLCIVNSFFGLEAAKDIPPNVAAVGPILSDEIDPLNESCSTLLSGRSRVLYMSLGTHVLPPGAVLVQLLSGVMAALNSGVIDGVIWAIRPMARKQINPSAVVADSTVVKGNARSSSALPSGGPRPTTMASLLDNKVSSVLVVEHAPQRALLQDERVAVFLTHAGPSSSNEAVFAGTAMITLPVYFDQLQNALRLRDAGVSLPLNKDTVRAEDVRTAIEKIVDDLDHEGTITTNLARIRRIAQVASRRKHFAADLIEEVLADSEGRRKEERLVGHKSRGMHLQTADGRMPTWKARNWDIWGVTLAPVCCLVGAIVVFAKLL